MPHAVTSNFIKPRELRIQVQWIEPDGDGEKHFKKEFFSKGDGSPTEKEKLDVIAQAKHFVKCQLKEKFDSGKILTITIVRVVEILTE